jgi:hypothetical protein
MKDPDEYGIPDIKDVERIRIAPFLAMIKGALSFKNLNWMGAQIGNYLE